MNEGKKILVIEDNKDFLEVVCVFLSMHFRQIKSADSFSKARAIMRDWKPDVVLADFHLPDAKATALIGEDQFNTPKKFLVMTGDLRLRENLEETKEIDKVLFKPFGLNALLDAIANGQEARR